MAKKTNPENLLEGILSEDQIDALVNSADSFGQGQSGIEELLAQMTKAVLERALETEIRDGGAVKNKACHIAVGVDMEGRKQVLGMWIADQEGAKFWANVLAQLSGPVKLPVGLP